MFQKFKFGRNQIIAGVIGLLVAVTCVSMIRVTYNQNIVDTYERNTKKLPERTKIGILNAFWQQYLGNTDKKNITLGDAQKAKMVINSTYNFMFGVDGFLGIAAVILIVQPMIANRLKKK